MGAHGKRQTAAHAAKGIDMTMTEETLRAQVAYAEADVATLCSQVATLREALRYLLDEQNGPPLHRREEQWTRAYNDAESALAVTAPNGGAK